MHCFRPQVSNHRRAISKFFWFLKDRYAPAGDEPERLAKAKAAFVAELSAFFRAVCGGDGPMTKAHAGELQRRVSDPRG